MAMIIAASTAGTGMIAQQAHVDSIGNNLANIETTGYKKNDMEFADLLYLAGRSASAAVPVNSQIGLGVAVASDNKVFTEGPLEQAAAGSVSAAVQGQGFFQIRLPGGAVAYTRDGNFHVDGATRQIVTDQGLLLQPNIVVPANAIDQPTIGADGLVTVPVQNANGTTSIQAIGQIQLANFINPEGLLAQGSNLFLQTGASGAPIIANPGQRANGILVSGFVENSNVNVATELIQLLLAQRALTFNTRTFTVANEMLQTTADLINP